MEYKNINCPNCNKPLEYWTLGTSIECTGCKSIVEVEPCEPEVIEIPEAIGDEIELIEVGV